MFVFVPLPTQVVNMHPMTQLRVQCVCVAQDGTRVRCLPFLSVPVLLFPRLTLPSTAACGVGILPSGFVCVCVHSGWLVLLIKIYLLQITVHIIYSTGLR